MVFLSMIKRIGFISIVLFPLSIISSVSFGKGFFIGAGIGPELIDFGQNATIIRINTYVKDQTYLSGKGIFGSLFTGYAEGYKRFYFAEAINIDVSSANFQSSNKNFSTQTFSNTKYQIDHSIGASVLPGVLLFTQTTLFYGRVGYEAGHFKISTTDSSLVNLNQYLNGVCYGVGIQQQVGAHVDVFMEYDHLIYESTSRTAIDNMTTKSTSISPQTNQVMFGFLYLF